MVREPRPEGRIVELVNLPTRFEADTVIGRLRARASRPWASTATPKGGCRTWRLLDGFRVCVFETDLDAATALLEEEGIEGA